MNKTSLTLDDWISSFPSGQKFTMKKVSNVVIIRADGLSKMFVIKNTQKDSMGVLVKAITKFDHGDESDYEQLKKAYFGVKDKRGE